MTPGAPPAMPRDWGEPAGVRAMWRLDPAVTYLNHGAYGATPRVVLDEQARLRDVLESEPTDFLSNHLAERLDDARAAAARLLRADVDGLVYVPNAMTGVVTALHNQRLRPGDEVVFTDHCYSGVRHGLRRFAAERRARLVEVPLDLDASAADHSAAVLGAVTARTRVVVVDAITSATALVLPYAEIVRGCRDRGVTCIVDAAHAPAQLADDLAALDPDYWVGNLHKWAYAPKGTAVLVVRAALRERTRPLVASHGAGQGFLAEFRWSGTLDPTGWFAAPVGLALFTELGPDVVRQYGHDLAWWGACHVANALGIAPPLGGPERHPMMALVDPGPLEPEQALALYAGLRAAGVEVPVTAWRDRFFVRVSAQAYNQPGDYERLAQVLPEALAGARKRA